MKKLFYFDKLFTAVNGVLLVWRMIYWSKLEIQNLGVKSAYRWYAVLNGMTLPSSLTRVNSSDFCPATRPDPMPPVTLIWIHWIKAKTGDVWGEISLYYNGGMRWRQKKKAFHALLIMCLTVVYGGGHGLLNKRSAGIIEFNDRLTLTVHCWQTRISLHCQPAASVPNRPDSPLHHCLLKRGGEGSKVRAWRSSCDRRLSRPSDRCVASQ